MADEKNVVTVEQMLDFAQKADKRLDALEANATQKQDLTLAASGWTDDSGDTKYPYQYILTVTGVTTASKADAVLDDASVEVASECGVHPNTNTGADTVIFKSKTAPADALTGVLYIKKNAALSST